MTIDVTVLLLPWVPKGAQGTLIDLPPSTLGRLGQSDFDRLGRVAPGPAVEGRLESYDLVNKVSPALPTYGNSPYL